MREILFKAKRLDNGEWVEGLLTIMWGEYHIIHQNNENLAYPITEETICQFTGLTDKNGNKIWENDICYYDDMDICVIRFGEYDNNTGHKHIGFRTDWQKYKDLYRHDLGFWVTERELEVIGNIFDNPELLEGGAV